VEFADASAFSAVVKALSGPVFLAGLDKGTRPRLTLHVPYSVRRRQLLREAERALGRAGIAARCRVRVLDYRRLARARSLEEVLRALPHERAVYDPTLSVARTRALTGCVARLRRRLGEVLRGAYLEPRSRTLYLVLRPESTAAQGSTDAEVRASLAARTAAMVESWLDEEPDAFKIAVRLGTTPPPFPVIAIDDASISTQVPARARLTAFRLGAIAGGVAALFGLSHAALAQAVSDPNAKLSIEGGDEAGPLGLGTGSVALPLGTDFGAQFDGLVGDAANHTAWGVGGQLFWRDPSTGLFGGFADHVSRGGPKLTRVGPEAEVYLGRFTVSGRGGYEDNAGKHGGFGRVDLSFYPIDNLSLTVGPEVDTRETLAHFGVEYMFGIHALPGLSVFAEAAAFGAGLKYGVVGFRYYFGADKTLIRRHREDDPPNTTGQDITDVTTGSSIAYGTK
jgi:hypothetical protein